MIHKKTRLSKGELSKSIESGNYDVLWMKSANLWRLPFPSTALDAFAARLPRHKWHSIIRQCIYSCSCCYTRIKYTFAHAHIQRRKSIDRWTVQLKRNAPYLAVAVADVIKTAYLLIWAGSAIHVLRQTWIWSTNKWYNQLFLLANPSCRFNRFRWRAGALFAL